MGFGSRNTQGSQEEQDYQLGQSMLQGNQNFGVRNLAQGIPYLMSGTQEGPFAESLDLGAFLNQIRGDDGEQGPQGIQGNRGPRGEKGEKGDKGEPGVDGTSPVPTNSLQVVTDVSYNSSNGQITIHKKNILLIETPTNPSSEVSSDGTSYLVTTAAVCTQ